MYKKILFGIFCFIVSTALGYAGVVDVVDMGNGVYRVLIYSFGNKAIEGHSGLLLTVPFTVAEGVDATSVEAENIVLSNREGNNSASYIGEWVDVTNKIVNAEANAESAFTHIATWALSLAKSEKKCPRSIKNGAPGG